MAVALLLPIIVLGFTKLSGIRDLNGALERRGHSSCSIQYE